MQNQVITLRLQLQNKPRRVADSQQMCQQLQLNTTTIAADIRASYRLKPIYNSQALLASQLRCTHIKHALQEPVNEGILCTLLLS
jgi:hypothetical protein